MSIVEGGISLIQILRLSHSLSLLVGFFLGWLGAPGKGRALGVGEVKFSGEVLNFAKKVKYTLHIKKVIIKRLALAVADGIMSVDGKNIYTENDLKVGLFKSEK